MKKKNTKNQIGCTDTYIIVPCYLYKRLLTSKTTAGLHTVVSFLSEQHSGRVPRTAFNSAQRVGSSSWLQHCSQILMPCSTLVVRSVNRSVSRTVMVLKP